jgi:hypothetical protein
MRDNDLINLEEAYQTIEENKLRSLAAAAALGLGGLAHGAPTADDLADKANNGSFPVMSQREEPKVVNKETSEHKAHVAMKVAVHDIETGQHVGDNILKLIALDQETAEKYSIYLMQRGRAIPSIIKAASPKYVQEVEDYAKSNLKN